MILCAGVLVLSLFLWIVCRKKMSEEKRKILGVIMAAALLGSLEGIAKSKSPVLLEENRLKRHVNGNGNYEVDLGLTVDEKKEEISYHIEVPEQVLTRAEEQAYLDAAAKELEEEFPGNNPSVNCIRERVVIRDNYQGGKVDAVWNFDNYRIMDTMGNVIAAELKDEGELVRARVELSCGTSERVEEFYFRVFPRILDEEERFFAQLEKTIAKQGQATGEEYLQLPDSIGDHRLYWKEKRDHTPEKILIFGGILAGFIPAISRSRQQEQQKRRTCLLELEYPDMVSKLALLLGSGMTLQGAFRRIADSYEEKRKTHRSREMPVYEEMLVTCREMESGVGEQRAYEHFGERCGGAMYRKFANILTQNLKKGSQGVVQLLEQEVETAYEDRKSAAKRYGEEAGTKLLFPMMIMLGIVMLILLIPAVFTFQI